MSTIFRDPADFVRRRDYGLIGRILREAVEVYATPADGFGIGALVLTISPLPHPTSVDQAPLR
jgi:hypothetical protein